MEPRVQQAMDALREFMFDKVYRDSWRAAEEAKCDYVIRALYQHYHDHPSEMPEEFLLIGYRDGIDRAAADYISCMTDRFAIRDFERLFVPTGFSVL